MNLLVYAVLLRDYNYASRLHEQLPALKLSVADRKRIFRGLFAEDHQISKYSSDLAFIGGRIAKFKDITPELPYALPESFFIQRVTNRVYGVDKICYEVQDCLSSLEEGSLTSEQADTLGYCLNKFRLVEFFEGNDAERLKFIEEFASLEALNILQLGIFGEVRELEVKPIKELLVKHIVLCHIANTPREKGDLGGD